MKTYDLYVESGPMRRKTMVHVPALAGCIARGDTTDAALEATPEAIRAYLRFLARHGEGIAPTAALKTRVVEHQTEGPWLGQGLIFIETDLEPLSARDAAAMLARLGRIHAGLRELTADMTAGYKAIREKFTSKVELFPPERIKVTYLTGPMRTLHNDWRFIPNEDGSCTVDFFIEFEFRSRLLEKLIGGVFDEIVKRMVSAFVIRADTLYGSEKRLHQL